MADKFFKLPAALAGRKDISAAAKLCYAAIVDRIGRHGHAWPGIRTTARDTGLGKNAVARAINKLVDKGLLMAERPGQGKVNHYRLPSPETVPETGTVGQQGVSPKRGQSVPETGTELSPKRGPNQTQTNNQTNKTEANHDKHKRARPAGGYYS